jgi:hypothetical protein
MPETKSIWGLNKIYFKVTEATRKIQIDLFPEYVISSIKLNDKNLEFSRKYGAVFIDLGEELKEETFR